MSDVPCRACGEPAPYVASDRRGDIHVCENCETKTVYPMHVEHD